MLGMLIGDWVGSAYEGLGLRGYNLPLHQDRSRLTDDSVISVAMLDALTRGEVRPDDFAQVLREWVMANDSPAMGYGDRFHAWIHDPEMPAQPEEGSSDGNGAAVRAAAIALSAPDSLVLGEAVALPPQWRARYDGVYALVRNAVRITHSEDALEWASAVALTIVLVREGYIASQIYEQVRRCCFVDLACDLTHLHADGVDSCLASETVAPALFIGLTATSGEDALRRVLYIGGDTDTLGAIAGAVVDARGLSWPDELVSAILGPGLASLQSPWRQTPYEPPACTPYELLASVDSRVRDFYRQEHQ